MDDNRKHEDSDDEQSTIFTMVFNLSSTLHTCPEMWKINDQNMQILCQKRASDKNVQLSGAFICYIGPQHTVLGAVVVGLPSKAIRVCL